MHRARHTATRRVFTARSAVALAVAAAGLATAIWLPARFDNAAATVSDRPGVPGGRRDGDRVVFVDEFQGRRGDRPSREKWMTVTGPQAGEVQVFTDHSRNVRLDGDGNLVITARQHAGRLTSARLVTRQSFAGPAGRVEARVKVADDRGVRSVFQLLGAEDVDVMAGAGGGSTVIRGATGARDGSFTAPASFAGDFHTFAVDWAPGRVVWSVDGTEFLRTAHTLAGPFTASVALTAGGAQAGRPDDSTRSPQRMLVDLVRVTTRAGGHEPPAPTSPTSGPTTPPATTTPPSEPAPPPGTTSSPVPAAKAWQPFTLYSAGTRVAFAGRTYEVRETHTSLPAWEPPAVPALFEPI